VILGKKVMRDLESNSSYLVIETWCSMSSGGPNETNPKSRNKKSWFFERHTKHAFELAAHSSGCCHLLAPARIIRIVRKACL
jgi:hypothetical protein